ncbi:MAG: polyketide synthase dehydratase domain-containing protein, partial [Sinobacterium sp.]|nr:polyketide synthase dehydratase domain-containing protein [Sinobacterium sp.]
WPVVADKHPVIPLTMELMILKELAEEHFPALKAIAIEDVHAFNWLIVETPVDLNIHLNFQSLPYVDIEIEGYVKGRVKLAEKYPTPPTYKAYDLKGLRPAAVTAKQLYDDHWMFHGPAYQGVIELGPIANNGIRGRLQTPKGKGSLLDNMGQLAGYFVMEQDKDSLAMPIGIDKINFYADPSAVGECFDSEVKIQKLNDDECFSDLQLVDDRQQVRVSIDGWKTRRFKMDRRFWLQSKQADTRLLSEEISDGVLLFHDRYETAITRDYMQKRYLAVPEREAFATVSLRRRRNWLNGRIAAKDACKHFLWQQKDQVFSVYPKEICVLNDEHGAPHLSNNVSEILQQNLCVSIAHKDRYAIARVSDKPIGVDIESIEVRSEEFVQLSFSSKEQTILESLLKDVQRDEVLTRCWSAKECVAKQGGKGLEGSPKKFSVTAIDNEKIQINEQWVQTQKYDNYIIAWTL